MKEIDIKTFALHFSKTRNAVESAIAIGINPIKAKLDGIKLIYDRKFKRQIMSIDKANNSERCDIRTGLERLAYGRVNDAVALVFYEEITPHMLAEADLFNVSEIKKIKGGGVEIKFFDRQKALERLDEINNQLKNDEKAKNLVEAIYGCETNEIHSDLPLEGVK